MANLNLNDQELQAFLLAQNATEYTQYPAQTLSKLFCVDIVEAEQPASYLLPDYGSVVIPQRHIGQILAFIRSKNGICLSTRAAMAAVAVLSNYHSRHQLAASFSGDAGFENLEDFAAHVIKNAGNYSFLASYAANLLGFYKIAPRTEDK